MKILHMCDYCEYEIQTCNAIKVIFGIDLKTTLEEPKLNDAVVSCDSFKDNGLKGVVSVKI